MKYKVTYEHEVVITYEAIIEANSEEEAMDKASSGDFISEEKIGWQGIEVRPQSTELIEE